MKIIKTFLPNEFIYDNTKNHKNTLILKLEELTLEIDFNKIINTHFSLGNISKDEIEIIKRSLGIGMFYKAPCGGFVNFYKIKAKNNIEYILYSGVSEVSNSHYVVILYKVLELR
jgi:hypothetical protein